MSQHDSRGIAAPLGFRAAGMHCGIKKAGLLDLALVVSEVSGPIAGVFTTNQVVAAPVTLDRHHLRQGLGRAILVNSGNANACTGRQGMAAARKTAALVARKLGSPTHEVFIGSTGVIGRALPVDRIVKALPALFDRLSSRRRRTGRPRHLNDRSQTEIGGATARASTAGLLPLAAWPRAPA